MHIKAVHIKAVRCGAATQRLKRAIVVDEIKLGIECERYRCVREVKRNHRAKGSVIAPFAVWIVEHDKVWSTRKAPC